MQSSKITARGQTTIPSDIRKHLNLKSGDSLRYLVLENGDVYLVRKRSVMDLEGMLHQPGRKPVTLEEMDEGIAAGAAASL